jgi:hypothetical protein
MTATSAHSANGTSSTANPFLRDAIASLRTVQVPGTPATYANRAALRAMGLRWDPVGRRWHGTTTTDQVRILREQLGLEVRCFGTLNPPRGPSPPRPPAPAPKVSGAPQAIRDHDPVKRLHDGLQTNPSGSSHPRPFVPGTRTRAEARVAYRDTDEDAEPEEVVTQCRRFTVLEITSGLADDSREADEKQVERRLRDLRARVKLARATVSRTPGLAEILAADWKKTAGFYTRFGISESMFGHGVPNCTFGEEGTIDQVPAAPITDPSNSTDGG